MGMEAADPILKIKTAPVFEPPLKTARYKGACARNDVLIGAPNDTLRSVPRQSSGLNLWPALVDD
jgi:hypothetical protein